MISYISSLNRGTTKYDTVPLNNFIITIIATLKYASKVSVFIIGYKAYLF